jgi:hypothetical protein
MVYGSQGISSNCYWLGAGDWSLLLCQEVDHQWDRTKIPAVMVLGYEIGVK